MFPLLRELGSQLKSRKVHIDGNVFRLHTSVTVVLLLAFSVLLTAKDYVGSPIDCYCPSIEKSVLDSFCWIESTYSLKSLFAASRTKELAYPGTGNDRNAPGDRQYHRYYQWVCFLLFGQAMFFYFPRWLWCAWEGGRVPAIVSALDVESAAFHDSGGELRSRLVDFLVLNLNRNNWYFAKYLLCELVGFLNVIAQVMLTDVALSGTFVSYGSDVVEWYRTKAEQRLVSPMVRAFPRMAMCSFFRYGDSGALENREAVCVLPVNIVNEKLFLFLWFWYMLLLATGALLLVYRVLLVIHAPLRYGLLRARYPDSEQMGDLVRSLAVGDVFLLGLIGQNTDPLVFGQLVRELSQRVPQCPHKNGRAAQLNSCHLNCCRAA
ncbi:hypothetical protein HPB47_025822 [Ixodes persulcatus]|uniref:Uncharacterized protein n=1 Tax=Ixodes persulcatus TaxID=34615 RepID=A0AC60Q0S4_IXOPE|nr:hypothetical protein HPB47_025822 [Ixodes persulcatus]